MNEENLKSQSAQPIEVLWSNDGNDFLFGTAGDDELDGGGGRDTAVYSGTPLDYDIWKNSNGSWSVRNVRGAKNAGSDTLKNIEILQFDGGKTYELKKAGLTFQTDFALVIDTTGSMGSSIGSVKTKALELIDAVFAGDQNDGRIGVVGFKDAMIGEPSEVILPFTNQNDFAARKSATIAAINGITVNGGGDWPETPFNGLRVALNGSMGQWRFGAGVLRIALFTDAPSKDGYLADEVTTLASSIGASITMNYSRSGSRGSVDTFDLAFGGDSLSDKTGSNPGDPITPNPTTAQVQIFTIFTGSSGDTSALKNIAGTTGGDFFTVSTNKNEYIASPTGDPTGDPIKGPIKGSIKGPIKGPIRDDFFTPSTDEDEYIAGPTEGDSFTPSTDEDLVSILLKIINLPPEPTNTPSKGTATATASGAEVGVNLDGSSRTDKLSGTPKNDILNGGVGVDRLTGDLGGEIFTGGSEADNFVFTERSASLLDNFDRRTNLAIGTNVIDDFNTVTAANITKVGVSSALSSSKPGWDATFLEPTVGGGVSLSSF
jgi:hypothetical protein